MTEIVDGQLEIVDATSGRKIHKHPVAHGKGVSSISWSSDTRYVATGSDDGSVEIWDLERDQIRTIYGKDCKIERVDFSPDGDRLLIEGIKGDRKISIWDPKKFQEIVTFDGFTSAIERSAWHYGGQMIVYQVDSSTIAFAKIDRSA